MTNVKKFNIEYFKKIAHSNNKQTQLITHNILNTTSKKLSLVVTTPKSIQYKKQKSKYSTIQKIENNNQRKNSDDNK